MGKGWLTKSLFPVRDADSKSTRLKTDFKTDDSRWVFFQWSMIRRT